MSSRVIVIAGPTAVGKSTAAVGLARLIDGEIINADSRQVYRGFTIGAAIPTPDEREGVPHHLYGFSAPNDDFSLGRFLEGAACAIADIQRRGKTPIIVGGTGQYVWALVEGWNVPAVAPNPHLRRELFERAEGASPAALHAELRRLDPAAAEHIHPNNLIRIIRALEVIRETGRPFSALRTQTPPPWDTRIAGLTMERSALDDRIARRVEQQLDAGWVDEVRSLLAQGYSPSLSSFRSIGYREIAARLEDQLPPEDMRSAIVRRTRRFARTQFAWFRADDPRIAWLDVTPQPSPGHADADAAPDPAALAESLRDALRIA